MLKKEQKQTAVVLEVLTSGTDGDNLRILIIDIAKKMSFSSAAVG